jgi:hypothetical protein
MTAETPSEVDDEDACFWHAEIRAAQSRRDDWYKQADRAIRRYEDGEDRKFGSLNILWANVETQKSALDDDFGKPQVSRFNKSKTDSLARHVSMVLEQTLDAAVKDTQDNYEICSAVHDILLPGMGQVWLELNPVEDEDGSIISVDAPIVHLGHKDYLEGISTRDGDVPWKARRHLYTLDDLRALDKANGTAHADKVPRAYSLPMPTNDGGGSEVKSEQFRRASVWEIWSKHPHKRRIYIAEDYDVALKIDPDPYRLKPFFPCPRPIIANPGRSKQIPQTDYSRYMDQAAEIDRISQRIFVLTEVLRHNGVCDQKFAEELMKLADSGDNKLVPIEEWAEFLTKGGLQSAVQYTDLLPIIQVLDGLHKQRSELIQLTYELTGISDLARGQTDPNETLGAQKLKKSYGSGRFKARHKESRRFARDAYALKGELIAEHFQRDQIQSMSGIALPALAERQAAAQSLQAMNAMAQQMQQTGQQLPFSQDQMADLNEKASARYTWEDTSAVLRSDARRCYMVDIETDQSKFADEEEDKSSRIEFIGMVNQLMQQFGPMIAGNPASGEVFKKLIMFALLSFKAGRAMEEGVEQAIDGAIQNALKQAQQPQQPQGDPVQAAQASLIQAQAQKALLDVQTAEKMGAIKIQIEQINLQIKQEELRIKQAEVQTKAVGQQIDMQDKAMKAAQPPQIAQQPAQMGYPA